MSNIKLHPSTVWTLRTKKKLLEKIKKWKRRIREKYSQSKHNSFSIQKKGNTIADCLQIFNEKTGYGPLYVCTVYLQTWFKSSVYDVSKLFLRTQNRTCLQKVQKVSPQSIIKNGYIEHVVLQ